MSALPPGEATAEYDHKLFNAAAHHGAAVPETPPHVLSEETIEALKKVNSTAVVDVLARNGYEPRTCYMENVRSMQSGQRLVARAITVRFVPARADAMAEKPSGEDSPEYAAFERAGPGDCIVMEAMRTKVHPTLPSITPSTALLSPLPFDLGSRLNHVAHVMTSVDVSRG